MPLHKDLPTNRIKARVHVNGVGSRWTSASNRVRNKQGTLVTESVGIESVAELRAREQEVAREWEWLNDALNTVARVRAENGDAAAFRLMQSQAMRVGQRRIEHSLRIVAIEGPARGP
jgi:hypothetical protein